MLAIAAGKTQAARVGMEAGPGCISGDASDGGLGWSVAAPGSGASKRGTHAPTAPN